MLLIRAASPSSFDSRLPRSFVYPPQSRSGLQVSSLRPPRTTLVAFRVDECSLMGGSLRCSTLTHDRNHAIPSMRCMRVVAADYVGSLPAVVWERNCDRYHYVILCYSSLTPVGYT
jgi:hypothetical protein